MRAETIAELEAIFGKAGDLIGVALAANTILLARAGREGMAACPDYPCRWDAWALVDDLLEEWLRIREQELLREFIMGNHVLMLHEAVLSIALRNELRPLANHLAETHPEEWLAEIRVGN